MKQTVAHLAEMLGAEYTVNTDEAGCLVITDEDGVEAFLTATGDQVLIESLLFEASEVMDPAALNEEILRTHKLLPLTTVGITTVKGTDFYAAFGSLSAGSSDDNVREEVDMLFINAQQFVESFSNYLK